MIVLKMIANYCIRFIMPQKIYLLAVMCVFKAPALIFFSAYREVFTLNLFPHNH